MSTENNNTQDSLLSIDIERLAVTVAREIKKMEQDNEQKNKQEQDNDQYQSNRNRNSDRNFDKNYVKVYNGNSFVKNSGNSRRELEFEIE